MIKQLRTKLAATSMVATNIVLVVAIIVIFFMGFTRIDTDRKDDMQRALSYPLDERTTDDFFRDFANSNVMMVVCVNGETPTLYIGKGVSVAFQERVFQSMEDIVNSQQMENYTSYHLNYCKQVEGNTVKIACYDPSNYRSGFVLGFYALFVLIVGVLSHSVISMMLAQSAIKPIEESWNKQRQFVADASHELKTPLSIIMANTEIIASHPNDTVESQMKWINNTLAESKRMASLVQDLLFLAKSDDGVKVPLEQTSLTECVESCVLMHEAVFYENNKTFTSQIAQDVLVLGNEGQLKQLFTILLDNANKYAIGEGNIALTLEVIGKHATVTLSNDSDVVSDEQMKHLFDRFYTLDLSRNKNNGGNGLGLSIAERIVQTHNGSISAEYRDGKMTFKVTLPLCRKKTAKTQQISNQ